MALQTLRKMKTGGFGGQVEPNAYTYSALLKTMGEKVSTSARYLGNRRYWFELLGLGVLQGFMHQDMRHGFVGCFELLVPTPERCVGLGGDVSSHFLLVSTLRSLVMVVCAV